MEQNKPDIRPYTDAYREQLLTVWEQSVLATHYFLSKADFEEIKQQLQGFDFNVLSVYCLFADSTMAGFVGVAGKKVEMLFLHPDYRGRGMGKQLMNFAIHMLAANKLDVNEQNLQAVAFYQKMGFQMVERTDKDEQGRNYPLLRMQLKRQGS